MSESSGEEDIVMVDMEDSSGMATSSQSKRDTSSDDEIEYIGQAYNPASKTHPTGLRSPQGRSAENETKAGSSGEVAATNREGKIGAKRKLGGHVEDEAGEVPEGKGKASEHIQKKQKPSNPHQVQNPSSDQIHGKQHQRQTSPPSLKQQHTPQHQTQRPKPPHQSHPAPIRPRRIKLPPEVKKETRVTDFVNIYIKDTLKCPIDAYRPSGGVDGAMLQEYVDGTRLKREKEKLDVVMRGRWDVVAITVGGKTEVQFTPKDEFTTGPTTVQPFILKPGDHVLYQKASQWSSPDISDAVKTRNPHSIDSSFSRFGKIISITPDGFLHLHQLRHDMHSPLHGEKAHPKRLHELEFCKDIDAKYVAQKISVVRNTNALGPDRKHPRLDPDQYLLQYRWQHDHNAFVTVEPESVNCPGCQCKAVAAFIDDAGLRLARKVNEEDALLQVGNFVTYFNDKCAASGLCGLGQITRLSLGHQAVRVRMLERWDLKVAEAFEREEETAKKGYHPILIKNACLLYESKEISKVWIKAGDVVGKINVLSVAQTTSLGRALREAGLESHGTNASIKDFERGLSFITADKETFYINNVDYLSKLCISLNNKASHVAKLAEINLSSDLHLSEAEFTGFMQTTLLRTARELEVSRSVGIIDCCSGVGGFSLGLQQGSGASVSLAVEPDQKIGKLYRQTHPNTTLLRHGAGHVGRYWKSIISSSSDIDSFDEILLMAGIPCQGFSGMNTRKKADDPRNGIIYEVISLLQVSKANYLLLENVPGILFHKTESGGEEDLAQQQGEILRIAARILADMGYQVNLNLYRSEGYGLATTRKRIFLWAAKTGRPLPAPPSPAHPYDIAGDSLAIKFGSKTLVSVPNDSPIYPSMTVTDAMSDLRPLSTTSELACAGDLPSLWGFLGEKSYQHPPLNSYQTSIRSSSEKRTSLHYCKVPDGNTLQKLNLAREGMISRDQKTLGTLITTGLWPHMTQKRPLSLREICRVTGFPDHLNLHLDVSQENKGREYDAIQKGMGNAVPVLLAKAHGQSFLGALLHTWNMGRYNGVTVYR